MSQVKPSLDRRTVLGGTATLGAVAVGAGLFGQSTPALVAGATGGGSTKAAEAPTGGGGYRVTAHVQDYYRTARI